ncbi:unnamed protein product [Acanthoscelides obtectus]|uniref:Uncharacterized protein n=1 Tax=Acanthoscelides obtectus TaxID=200917 RepID=A0A9P0Q1H7_ACAOB|nr:unnamed protein product [Acanthoscelides obtectus]CAK1670968.1 hypothetical protein AOBTE_LOCUS27954 [Acanthoscelides obtectus]
MLRHKKLEAIFSFEFPSLSGIGDVVKNLGAANKEITAKVAATLGVDTAVAEAIIAAIGWSAVPALIAGAAFPLGPGLKPWPVADPAKLAIPVLAVLALLGAQGDAVVPLVAAEAAPVAIAEASPAIISSAISSLPAVLTKLNLPLFLSFPIFFAIFSALAPVLLAAPAAVAPAAVAALLPAPFAVAKFTTPFPFGYGLPVVKPEIAALLKLLKLRFNIGFFAPFIVIAALPLLTLFSLSRLWATPLAAFFGNSFFPGSALTAAFGVDVLHNVIIAANKFIQ